MSDLLTGNLFNDSTTYINSTTSVPFLNISKSQNTSNENNTKIPTKAAAGQFADNLVPLTIKKPEESKQEPKQPSGEKDEKDDKPSQEKDLKSIIWGLPPILFSSDRIGTPDLVNEQLLKNSFPILTIGEVSLETPKKSGVTKKPTITTKGQPYKFAVKNEGGVTYTISNEYGPSQIEEWLQKTVQSEVSSELFQLAKSNRLLNSMFRPLYEKVQPTLNRLGPAITKDINSVIKLENDEVKNTSLRGAINGIASIGEASAKALILGGKIDIPNIWQGSNGPISYSCSIILHCMSPDDDKEYEHYILEPLKILYRLASPHIMNENGSKNDNNKSNDILTYENPPYITAFVDGIFKTNIGAITNFSVNIDHKYQSFSHGGRPWLITVQLTITDLYNVIVWNDKTNQISPNALDIINFLKDHDVDKDGAGEIDKNQLSYSLDPCGFPGWKEDRPSNSTNTFTSDTSDISNIANTITNTINQVNPNSVNEQITLTPEIETVLGDSTDDFNYESWRRATNLSNDLYGNISTSLGDATSISLVNNDLLESTLSNEISTSLPSSDNIIDPNIADKWGLKAGGDYIIEPEIASKWRLRI